VGSVRGTFFKETKAIPKDGPPQEKRGGNNTVAKTKKSSNEKEKKTIIFGREGKGEKEEKNLSLKQPLGGGVGGGRKGKGLSFGGQLHSKKTIIMSRGGEKWGPSIPH